MERTNIYEKADGGSGENGHLFHIKELKKFINSPKIRRDKLPVLGSRGSLRRRRAPTLGGKNKRD